MTLDQFKAARSVLQGVIRPTNLIHSPALSKSYANQVYLKPENVALFTNHGVFTEAEIRARFETYRARFIEAMDDDLNTADALAALFELAREINTTLTAANEPSRELCEFALSLFGELADVLGLLYQKKEASLDEEIEALIAQRAEARKNRDWATADRIRDELKAMGVELIDTKEGTTWKRV